MRTVDITLTAVDETAIITFQRAHCVDIAGKQLLTEMLRNLREQPNSVRSLRK
jgi:hypothetical protein